DWLATFFQMALNPLLFFSYKSLGYGIEMLIFTALFFTAFLFFAYTLMGVVCGIEKKPLLHWCVIALTAPFVVGFAYFEIYCWFDGFCYGMYMAFLLLSFAFIVRFFYFENALDFVLATVFGCLNCVNLPTCVPIGLLYLYIWWNEPLDRGHRRIRHLTPLFLYVLVALTNLAAPGNFSRQGTTGESISVVKALLNAGYFCVRRGLEILTNWPVLTGFIILLLLGILVGGRVTSEVNHPHRLILLMMVGIFGAIFPVSLGYSSWRMPNRIEFIYDCLFMLSAGFCLFVVGQFIGDRFKTGEKTSFKVGLGAFVTAFLIVLFVSTDSPWTRAVLRPDAVLAERQANIEILDQLAMAEPDEEGWIVAVSEALPQKGVYSYIGLTTDGAWPSDTIANYFGKENARIEWKD
ncbi:MAG: hypothetical protein HUJ98_03445, partial [Bacteroidaceae bacterium]|nr:hypothetical protein [Bacteroidaceae bacterium]